MTLPDIHTWWPKLSIEAKHAIREHPDATLSSEVQREIARVTGHEVSDADRLSQQDIDFIATQQEPVD
ncbi:hypothetical protein [Microbacterium sp. YY-01]|uniref:hypothetical protein n=1 Tax=Microbacterium sp. YY-01 TaxID=3421634 RepID=UPI003D1768E2